MAGTLSTTADLEAAILRIGRDLHARRPRLGMRPTAIAERRAMAAMMHDPALRAAIFRFVDVRPACVDGADLVRHLAELLEQADGSSIARSGASLARRRTTRGTTANVAALGVRRMARRFIIGEDAASAVRGLHALWNRGAAATVDLLGEATVTEAEASTYAERCEATLRVLDLATRTWKPSSLLERDQAGAIPRVNLSIKVSALTPHLRPWSPERGIAGAEERLRHLLRVARDVGAHLHVDMEAFDTRETITELLLRLLSEPEFADGPHAGIVLQAYLVEAEDHLDRLIEWVRSTSRSVPFTVRLVKGAYWDHETVQATQQDWPVPVFRDRRACDRSFERLSRRLIDESLAGQMRAAIASHNLRSIAHAIAYAESQHADLELQVLRGLGDETLAALVDAGYRARCYCPVGDLVAGMAYLVRRLLENTSNDSFLSAQAHGVDITTLLEAP